MRTTYPPPIQARPPTVRPQYDLEMRPGESVDIPDEFNAGRKKRLMGWILGLALVLGMAALIITALASQR